MLQITLFRVTFPPKIVKISDDLLLVIASKFYTFPCDFSPQKTVFSAGKISDDLFLLFCHRLKISQFHIKLYFSPSKRSSNRSCTHIFFSHLKCKKQFPP